MTIATKQIAILSAALLACVSLAISQQQASAENHSSTCSIGVNEASKVDMNFGTNVPVVLIHGMSGSPAQWETSQGSSICDDINSLQGVNVALNFKYTALGEVDPRTMLRLDASIGKIADKSSQNGGPGKVIVVAYSLGTVYARTVFIDSSMAKKIGQVITIAAPSTPPLLDYPKGVVVRAIAGDIIRKTVLPFIGITVGRVDTGWDQLIGVNDALMRHTDNSEVGGGTVVARCTQSYLWSSGGPTVPFNPLCQHGNLLKNRVVRNGVIEGITAYVNSHPLTPTPTPTGTPAPTGTPTPGPTGTLPPSTSGPTSTCSTTSQTATPSSSPNPTSSPSSTTPPPVYCG